MIACKWKYIISRTCPLWIYFFSSHFALSWCWTSSFILSPFIVQFLLLIFSWKLISISPYQQQLISETFDTNSFPSLLGKTLFLFTDILEIRERLQNPGSFCWLYEMNEDAYIIWINLAHRKERGRESHIYF